MTKVIKPALFRSLVTIALSSTGKLASSSLARHGELISNTGNAIAKVLAGLVEVTLSQSRISSMTISGRTATLTAANTPSGSIGRQNSLGYLGSPYQMRELSGTMSRRLRSQLGQRLIQKIVDVRLNHRPQAT